MAHSLFSAFCSLFLWNSVLTITLLSLWALHFLLISFFLHCLPCFPTSAVLLLLTLSVTQYHEVTCVFNSLDELGICWMMEAASFEELGVWFRRLWRPEAAVHWIGKTRTLGHQHVVVQTSLTKRTRTCQQTSDMISLACQHSHTTFPLYLYMYFCKYCCCHPFWFEPSSPYSVMWSE